VGQETRGEAQDRTVVEISRMLDILEEQVRTGMRVPLTNRVAVEEEEFLATVDQLRASIPAELRQARRVIQDRQEIILAAQNEAERIINIARERAEYLTSSEGVMAEARHRSEELLRQSRSQNQKSVDEIESYALRVIGQVEQTMRNGLQDIEKAKSVIGTSRVVNHSNQS
jgi:N-glycosylase/DNA lyase